MPIPTPEPLLQIVFRSRDTVEISPQTAHGEVQVCEQQITILPQGKLIVLFIGIQKLNFYK
ncbi:hypothetical protein [Xylella fastidiosa]|uniref:hypothetical protein n=1 Tax=Xylella fastidiosa TaxID=2371 RepID=UPI00111D952A|nr:hypothetical protein [Xylella fastidiosa]